MNSTNNIDKALFSGEIGEKTEVGMSEGFEVEIGGYVKTEELNEGDVITILNAGDIKESQKFTNPDGSPKKQYVFEIELPDKQRKLMSLNKRSRVNLAIMFGKFTKNWVGKKAEVEKGTMMNGKEFNILKGVEVIND